MGEISKGAASGVPIQDRARGCLLGVAIGDALGVPFEHLGPGDTEHLLKISEGRVPDFQPWDGHPAGYWTDDTGMTLATCRGLVEAHKTGKPELDCLRRAYHAWAGSEECRRAGRTVVYASKYGQPDAQSWANGALMRISPVALYAHLRGLDKRAGATLAYRVARLTHGHPLATFPAVECVLALMSILAEERLVPADLSDPGRYVQELENDRLAHYETYRVVRHANQNSVHPSTGLWMWRQILERTLGLAEGAAWSSLPEFVPGLLKAVNDSFDKDTAGAVAGAVLGTYWGQESIPAAWRRGVEKAGRIVDLADALVDACAV